MGKVGGLFLSLVGWNWKYSRPQVLVQVRFVKVFAGFPFFEYGRLQWTTLWRFGTVVGQIVTVISFDFFPSCTQEIYRSPVGLNYFVVFVDYKYWVFEVVEPVLPGYADVVFVVNSVPRALTYNKPNSGWKSCSIISDIPPRFIPPRAFA